MITATASSIGIVILAAGASTRMGRPKQLLTLEGEPLIRRVTRMAVLSEAWPTVVVIGSHAAEIKAAVAREPVLIAENATWAEGMASSVRAGISTLQSFSRNIDAAVVALCDQPGFTSDVVARLIHSFRTEKKGIVAARYNGHVGAPALFAREHFAALSSLQGDQGARKLIASAASESLAIVDLPELANDLDTPEDYARVLAASAR